MRIYAERPARAALQVLADLTVLVWVFGVTELARAAQAAVLALQAPAARLTGAGEAIRTTFDGAASTASGVPFVGDDLARALGNGTGAGESLSASGRELAATAASAATGVAAAVVVLGAVPVVAVWLTVRVRWMRAAGSARTAREADPELLALRALARQPAHRLLDVTPDPAGAWRRAEPDAMAGLAALELRSLGLRASSADARDRPVGV
ncbi:MAG: hypothetical protein K0R87_631 [Pseudonocardia sp.]|nr:hypothetical protein [Pseudonocardia sp.]